IPRKKPCSTTPVSDLSAAASSSMLPSAGTAQSRITWPSSVTYGESPARRSAASRTMPSSSRPCVARQPKRTTSTGTARCWPRRYLLVHLRHDHEVPRGGDHELLSEQRSAGALDEA